MQVQTSAGPAASTWSTGCFQVSNLPLFADLTKEEALRALRIKVKAEDGMVWSSVAGACCHLTAASARRAAHNRISDRDSTAATQVSLLPMAHKS